MDINARITEALADAWGKDSVVLKPIGEYDKNDVYGIVVASIFRGLDDSDRQQLIWNALRKRLTKKEQAKIVALLAFTPEEEEAYAEVRA